MKRLFQRIVYRRLYRIVNDLCEATTCGLLGRCEVCDRTLDGPVTDHLAAAHRNEQMQVWLDPTSRTWTVLDRTAAPVE